MSTLTSATLLIPTLLASAGPPSMQAGPEPEVTPMRHLRIVAIDPGHGGHNRGCLGVDGTFEKVAVLDIAHRVARILTEETTAVALLTRDDDTFLGLRERTRMANDWDADVFLSVHLNADPWGKGYGVETWFLASDTADEEARRLVEAEEGAYADDRPEPRPQDRAVRDIARDASIRASQASSQALAAEVVRDLGESTGARRRGVKQARFGVLKEATMPAIVVECGFFSHHEEGVRLLDPAYREKAARGIVDGLVAYDRRLGGTETASR
ncbi:MAG: N-acetylmuramoyl-L-alanine amidase family protein [Myxococcota bacterium]